MIGNLPKYIFSKVCVRVCVFDASVVSDISRNLEAVLVVIANRTSDFLVLIGLVRSGLWEEGLSLALPPPPSFSDIFNASSTRSDTVEPFTSFSS